jgi:hypothetical protein
MKKMPYREALKDFDRVLVLNRADSFAMYHRRLVLSAMNGR